VRTGPMPGVPCRAPGAGSGWARAGPDSALAGTGWALAGTGWARAGPGSALAGTGWARGARFPRPGLVAGLASVPSGGILAGALPRGPPPIPRSPPPVPPRGPSPAPSYPRRLSRRGAACGAAQLRCGDGMAVCGRLLHTIAQSTLPRRDELPRVDTRTFDRMRATPLPPRSLFSRAQWRERGVSTRRLKRPELTTLFRGYSTPTAAPASVNTMCKVLQQQVAPEAVVSHSTAAALLGIALPWWVDNGIGALASAAYGDGPGFTVPSTLPQPPGAPDVPSD